MVENIEPLVTIMMPTFNRAEFISDAIESLMDQTYENWELIILDDGSTDSTHDIVSKFLYDKRIIYRKNEKNIGISKCRNMILGIANGDFIGHLDDDDILSPHAIGTLMNEFKKNTTLDLIYSDYVKIDADWNFISKHPSPDFNILNLSKLGFRHFCIYKRQIALDVGGFNEKLPHCSDGDIFMRIAVYGKCKRVPKYLYFYRSHRTNIGHKRPKCDICSFSSVCNYYIIWKKSVELMKIAKKSDEDDKKRHNNCTLRI